jgi:hypothetical protein
MASSRVDPEPIGRLRAQIHEVVTGHGFSLLHPTSQWTGKFNIVTWVRRSWKEDEIRLGWRKVPVPNYFLDASWAVPRPEGAGLSAAGINPGYMRRGLRSDDFPTRWPVVRALVERRWCAEIVADAEYALAWLDACSSLEGALSELERPERNGPRRDSQAYAYIEQYVRTHATPA